MGSLYLPQSLFTPLSLVSIICRVEDENAKTHFALSIAISRKRQHTHTHTHSRLELRLRLPKWVKLLTIYHALTDGLAMYIHQRSSCWFPRIFFFFFVAKATRTLHLDWLCLFEFCKETQWLWGSNNCL